MITPNPKVTIERQSPLNLKPGKPSKIQKKAANNPANGKQIQNDQPKVVAIKAYE